MRDRWHRADIGSDGPRIRIRYTSVNGNGHSWADQGAIWPPPFTNCRHDLLFGPGADARFVVGSDIWHDDNGEGDIEHAATGEFHGRDWLILGVPGRMTIATA